MEYSAADLEKLEEILGRLETIYAPLMDAAEYQTEGIREVMQSTFAHIGTLENPDETFETMSAGAAALVGELACLAAKTRYYKLQVAVFDSFPNIMQVSRFVFRQRKFEYAAKMDMSEYQNFAGILMYVDDERPEIKYGVTYRMVKLLLLLVLYKAHVHASVLAGFILQQIALSMEVG